MALTPTPTQLPDDRAKSAQRRDAEQDMLMREVDEAVRQDQATDFAKKYGVPLVIVFVLGMAAFAGFLWWQSSNESAKDERSEALVQAIDELEAGNVNIADGELGRLAGDGDGQAASAAMLRAGIALQQGRRADAVALFDEVANDADFPQEFREVAAIRSVVANYDALSPDEVISRIGSLAQPDSYYYGSAGELVAHAYLAKGNREQAGPLLVAISKDENVPSSIRGRTRQLAGLLGYDAIDDVDAALAEISGAESAPQAQLVE